VRIREKEKTVEKVAVGPRGREKGKVRREAGKRFESGSLRADSPFSEWRWIVLGGLPFPAKSV